MAASSRNSFDSVDYLEAVRIGDIKPDNIYYQCSRSTVLTLQKLEGPRTSMKPNQTTKTGGPLERNARNCCFFIEARDHRAFGGIHRIVGTRKYQVCILFFLYPVSRERSEITQVDSQQECTFMMHPHVIQVLHHICTQL